MNLPENTTKKEKGMRKFYSKTLESEKPDLQSRKYSGHITGVLGK